MARPRSRILKPVDDQPVWSIVCLFVHRNHRGAGVSTALIEEVARRSTTRPIVRRGFYK